MEENFEQCEKSKEKAKENGNAENGHQNGDAKNGDSESGYTNGEAKNGDEAMETDEKDKNGDVKSDSLIPHT